MKVFSLIYGLFLLTLGRMSTPRLSIMLLSYTIGHFIGVLLWNYIEEWNRLNNLGFILKLEREPFENNKRYNERLLRAWKKNIKMKMNKDSEKCTIMNIGNNEQNKHS